MRQSRYGLSVQREGRTWTADSPIEPNWVPVLEENYHRWQDFCQPEGPESLLKAIQALLAVTPPNRDITVLGAGALLAALCDALGPFPRWASQQAIARWKQEEKWAPRPVELRERAAQARFQDVSAFDAMTIRDRLARVLTHSPRQSAADARQKEQSKGYSALSEAEKQAFEAMMAKFRGSRRESDRGST